MLIANLDTPQPPRNLGLASGLTGLGIYFLERFPKAAAIEGIRLIVRQFEDLAEYREEGACVAHAD